MRVREESGSHALKRSSRRASEAPSVQSFDEPEQGNPSLKTTGQGISEYPDEAALTSLVDPEKVQRQQIRAAPKISRRSGKAQQANGIAAKEAEEASHQEEKLYLKLRRGLSNEVPSEYSDLRESPSPGEEDYRHNRVDKDAHHTRGANSAANTSSSSTSTTPRKRRRETDILDTPPSAQRRARRSTRPSYDDLPGTKRRHSENAYSLAVASAADRDPSTIELPKQAAAKPQSKPQSKPVEVKVEKPEVAAPPKLAAQTKNGSTVETPSAKNIINNDYCNSCGGTGELLCCETCVRSFHFTCLEPPVMSVDEIKEEVWSCRQCKPRRLPEKERERVSKTLFGALILQLEGHNTVAFQLPTNVRELFANIETSKYGECMDELAKTEIQAPGPRITDKNGDTLLCYKCQGSGLDGKEMAVCSQCKIPWHIDCVDPPLESTPLGHWVCPLHAENTEKMPMRVRNPQFKSVSLKRQVPNNGDIEIDEAAEEAEEEAERQQRQKELLAQIPNEREDAGTFSDEEVVQHIPSPAQTRMRTDGVLVAKSSRIKSRNTDTDRIVYKLPPRTIKLDFLDAVHAQNRAPYRETPTSDLLVALDCLATKPQNDVEAVRNLMHLKLQGPAVSTANAQQNLRTLLDAALDDENEIGQIAAIRKLMQEKGKERLLEALQAL